MTESIATQASRAAVLAAALRTRLDSGLCSSSDVTVLEPDPIGIPALAEVGFSLDTKGCDIAVAFHRDLRSRTFWLVIDRANAPLTGNYVCEVDTTVSTYDATSAAPADRDALLAGWAAQINTDISGVTATVTQVDPSGTGDDAVQVVVDNADPEVYATCSIGASTAAPEAAALHVLREMDSASLAIYTRTGADRAPDTTLSTPVAACYGAWRLTADIGALTSDGYDERGDFAKRRSAFLRLYDVVTDDETLTIAGSGAGIYGVEWVVAASVMGQVDP